MDNDKKYNYVVARYWNKKESDSLCCYTYGSTVFYGTKKSAKKLSKFISEKTGKKYKPFYINTDVKKKKTI